MKKPQVIIVSILVALLLTGTLALAQEQAGDATYTIRDMTFEGPDTLPAGMVTLNVVNEDEHDNLYALISLTEGRTIEEFFTTMGELFAGETSVVPRWIQFHGGSGIGIDDSRSYAIFLSPGTYYLVSIEADEEGPYAARGLLKPISVTADEPETDVTITTRDYEFEVDGTFVAGSQMVRVHNAANQPHEVLILPLPEGMSLEDMLMGPPDGAEGEHEAHEGDEETAEAADEEAAEEAEGGAEEAAEEGGPDIPASAVQGIFVINPGTTAFVTVNLEPGRYGMVCFVPDEDGPHAMQGMTLEFTVE